MIDDPKPGRPAIPPPPRGLGLLLAIGPGLVWCGEYIGSGEVILAARNGAIFAHCSGMRQRVLLDFGLDGLLKQLAGAFPKALFEHQTRSRYNSILESN